MALLLPAVMLQASPVSPKLAQSIAAQHLRTTTSRHAAPGRAVNNGTGDFVGTIPYMILNRQANDVLLTGETPMVTIAAGQSATINIASTFEGTPGLTYGMCLRTMDAPSEHNIWGEIAHFAIAAGPSASLARASDPSVTVTAAHGLLTVSGASRVAVYNITGALMGTGSQMRLPGGTYIVVADGTIHKVLMR